MLCLPNSNVVRSVTDDITLPSHSCVIDTTTGDPEATRQIGAELTSRGVSLLDATVLGSSEQMRLGEAMLLVGGEDESITRCADLFWCTVG